MSSPSTNTTRDPGQSNGPCLRDAAVLALLIGLFFTIFLGSRPLSVPDEGRYVEIPREMTVTGDWLTPRLNGVKYFEKPPLFYWFEAALIRLFGLSEWSVRIGPALFALFGCLAVYYAAARLHGRRAGVLSAIVLGTSVLYFALSRLISLDMPVSVLLTAALLSFLLGTREPQGTARRFFFWGFYAFAALATLTKGLIGIVIPGMVLGAWMLVMNEWRVLRTMHLSSGMMIFLLIAAPWHILADKANPEFFNFYFIHEHFQRYLTKVHHRFKPFWFFIPIIIGGFLPWSAFLVQAVRHALPGSWADRKQSKEAIYLMLWAGLVFLFFSASSSKLIPYVLPVLPPLAILVGKYLADMWKDDPVWGFPRNLATIAGAAALFLIVAGAFAPRFETRTTKPLAIALKPMIKADDEIIHFQNYYQDFPVYLERRVTIAAWKGELAFGSTVEDTSGWMIDEAEMWKRWQGPRRVFLLAGTGDAATLQRKPGIPFFLIAETKNTVILSNQETPR
jgi:4-amino-4-deoxy-L-arabinose transferase-like glycosyltransferase